MKTELLAIADAMRDLAHDANDERPLTDIGAVVECISDLETKLRRVVETGGFTKPSVTEEQLADTQECLALLVER